MTKVLGFLQARMGSTRLPGKVLMEIQGKSLLARAIERLNAARTLNGVVVLTTHCGADDAVVEEARTYGAGVFRGPDFDVLDRFKLAADVFCPDIVVRATADNPLIDIESVDRIVRKLLDENLDYCMEMELPVGAATEAMTRAALERAHALGNLPHHREHVTIFIKENLGLFLSAFPQAPHQVRFPEGRITVDTSEDFTRVQKLIEAIPESGAPIPLKKYIRLFASTNDESDGI